MDKSQYKFNKSQKTQTKHLLSYLERLKFYELQNFVFTARASLCGRLSGVAIIPKFVTVE